MIRTFCFITALLFCVSALGNFHASGEKDSTIEFLLVVRYNGTTPEPSIEQKKTIGIKWGNFIEMLRSSGRLIAGYRPSEEELFISGSDKKSTSTSDKKEIISSIFIIKAGNMQEASKLAKECPIFEMEGSVEVRAIPMKTQ